jgi:hypothetical protein
MLNKNSMAAGLLAALIFPVSAFAVKYLLKNNIFILNKPAVPYLVAIALNLILIRFCVQKDMEKTARGIMLATFAVMVLVFILKTYL